MKQKMERTNASQKRKLLRVGVGQSSNENSFKAGQEAISDALSKHPGTPEVLIVFGSTRFDHRQLSAGIMSIAGNIPMVGGTTAGEISTSGFSTQSVVIMALSSDELNFTTGIGKNMSQDEAACSVALVLVTILLYANKNFSDHM